jgi:hypothetical protein
MIGRSWLLSKPLSGYSTKGRIVRSILEAYVVPAYKDYARGITFLSLVRAESSVMIKDSLRSERTW